MKIAKKCNTPVHFRVIWNEHGHACHCNKLMHLFQQNFGTSCLQQPTSLVLVGSRSQEECQQPLTCTHPPVCAMHTVCIIPSGLSLLASAMQPGSCTSADDCGGRRERRGGGRGGGGSGCMCLGPCTAHLLLGVHASGDEQKVGPGGVVVIGLRGRKGGGEGREGGRGKGGQEA